MALVATRIQQTYLEMQQMLTLTCTAFFPAPGAFGVGEELIALSDRSVSFGAIYLAVAPNNGLDISSVLTLQGINRTNAVWAVLSCSQTTRVHISIQSKVL